MARFTDKGLGYDKFVKNFAEIAGKKSGGGPKRGADGKFEKRMPGVMVGVRADAGNDENGTSIAFIAAVNEFGSGDGHVPERSFLRSTLDENGEKYIGQLGVALGKVLSDKSSLRKELNLIGAGAAADVQRKITAIASPANAKSTVAKKGSSNPLIDDGQLRASIDFEVRGV